jgi:aspartate kinase
MAIVAKFGGTSLACSEQFKKVKQIVLSNKDRKAIIVSACGKRNDNDNKITNLLYLLSAHLKYGVSITEIYDNIKNRYQEILTNLNIDLSINELFSYLDNVIYSTKDEETIVSFGEYITAVIMAKYLGFEFVDARDLIIFNYDGKINYEVTNKNIVDTIDKYPYVVIPGFYGKYPSGSIKLLSRGGSDITGAIVASAINATIYENFTDVDGFYKVDPKFVKNAKLINEISYNEVRALSYMGASIFHEDAIELVQRKSIPIHILNTNNPLSSGTLITESPKDKSSSITGIVGKKGYKIITILKNKELDKLTFIQSVLELFKKYQIKIEHIPINIDSLGVIISNDSDDYAVFDLLVELRKTSGIVDVSITGQISLIAVISRNRVGKPGISGSIFSILGKNSIDVKMITEGVLESNIIFAISDYDYEKAITNIYKWMEE